MMIVRSGQKFKWNKLNLLPSGTISGGGVLASRSVPVGHIVMRAPKDSCLTFRSSALQPIRVRLSKLELRLQC